MKSEPVEINSLDDRKLIITMDEIISPQTIKVIKGEGMTIYDKEDPIKSLLFREKKGDLYLKFNIIFPKFIDPEKKEEIINYIKPQYLVLKPTLIGGLEKTNKWINIAENNNIGWWITSALESNIGLNAIAQFCGNYELKLPQGLGTGSLYTTNVETGLVMENGFIHLFIY